MCAFIEDIICVWTEGYRERKARSLTAPSEFTA